MNATTTRLQWPDVAKGICILLVVLHHVAGKQYGMVVPAGLDQAEDAWLWITAALKPIRMPLFFAVSGFFAASSVARPWAANRKRILNPYYLYVVWLLVYAGIYTFEHSLPANRTEGPLDFLTELVWAATSMWFLFALAVYFVLAKALRGLPAPVVLAAAAAVALSTSWLGLEETNRVAVLAHFGYFAFGAYYPQLLRRLTDVRLPLLVMLAAYVALTFGLEAAGARHSVMIVVLSLIGVPMGVGAAVRLARTRCTRPLAWLGQRTLPVYVMHLAVLAVVAHLPIGTEVGWRPATVALTATYPLLMTALIAAVCLGLHRLLMANGCEFLFAAPGALLDAARSVDHDPSGERPRASRDRRPARAGADGGGARQRAGGRGLVGGRAGLAALRDADTRPDPVRGRRDPSRHRRPVQPELLLPR